MAEYGPYSSGYQWPGTPSGGYDVLNSIQNFNLPVSPTPDVPFSPVVDPGVRDYLAQVQGIGGAQAPTWRNPYAYTSLAEAGSFGKYLGANGALLMGGLQTLSGLTSAYTGLKGLSLAKDAFNQQKKEFNINLDNQVRSYNTQVGDRIAGRHYNTEAERQAALSAAELVNRSKYGTGG